MNTKIPAAAAVDGPWAATPGERPQVGPLGPGQRWSLARKKAVVMRMLRGESVELLSREFGVPVHKLERWRDRASGALDDAMKESETEAVDGDLAAALRRVGDLTMENEFLRAKMERTSGPLAPRRSR